jgi:CRP-like cAMP-binding protein
VIIDDKNKGKLQPGDSFGELALVHNSRRTATIKTLEKS